MKGRDHSEGLGVD